MATALVAQLLLVQPAAAAPATPRVERGAATLAAIQLAVDKTDEDKKPDCDKEGEKPEECDPAPAPSPELKGVIEKFKNWLFGFATALAVLALTIAGLFYVTSAGSPTQVERAKAIVRATAVGYALMVLAPALLTALDGIVK